MSLGDSTSFPARYIGLNKKIPAKYDRDFLLSLDS
ncbi:hypothetical protein ACVW0P_003714 [Mucilaginibacter sp. UYNi724]